jgi:tyrosyl-tRNA synthetase
MATIDPKHGGLVWKKDEKPRDVNVNFNPVQSSLPIEEKLRRCLSVGQECIQPEELEWLLRNKEFPICYDGFEPSGKIHIAQGILKAINVNKLTSSGCIFIFWVADWFALLNNKMGGDLEKIQTTGRYLIETWKAAGMDMRNVKFLWTSEEINKQPNEYWLRVMDIARKNTFDRIKRCCTIMGRQESDNMEAAQVLYPCMQCSDIFFLKADICQLGMDQRKVNMLAREYCDSIHAERKPVILSHGMIMGLLEGQEKQSKSHPDSAIFMQDSVEDVERKVKGAFCPPGVVEGNPVLNMMKMMIFEKYERVTITRTAENGGDVTYASYLELEEDFASKKLHPADLKNSLVRLLNEMIQPVRDHFLNDPYARELYRKVSSYQITR